MNGIAPAYPIQHCVISEPCRHARWLACLMLLLLIACAHTPPAAPLPEVEAPSLRDRQTQTLRELGFVEEESGWVLEIAEPISFDFNDADLRSSLRAQLAQMGRRLHDVQLDRLRVEGHTDNAGDLSYNQTLSLRRAHAVAEVFISEGFVDEHIERRGLADAFPVADNTTREGRALNRRVSVIVVASSLAEG